MRNQNRVAACVVLGVVSLLFGCGDSSQQSAVATSQEDLPTEQYWSNYDHADWASVVPSEDRTGIVDCFGLVSRLIDRVHGGHEPRVEVFCDAHGRAFLRTGDYVRVELGDWKLLYALCQRKDGAAGRALPKGAQDYADGFGEVPRFAYRIYAGTDETLIFEMARPTKDGLPSSG